MTQIAVAVITAVAGILTVHGLPTLNRRIRQHSSLLKDLPQSAVAPLEDLLRKEVRELADRHAVPPVLRWLQGFTFVIQGVVFAAIGVLVFLGLELEGWVDPSLWLTILIVSLIAMLVALLFQAAAGLIWVGALAVREGWLRNLVQSPRAWWRHVRENWRG